MEWNEAQVDHLRDLWADPANSASEIARRMRTTKNAIVGKAHRIGLPPRPSPITGVLAARKPPKPHSAPKQTLLPMLVVVSVEPEPPPPPLAGCQEPCCWPIGEPGTRSFRYCDEPSLSGRIPYCEAHARIGYRGAMP